MKGWVGPVYIELKGSGKIADLVREELFRSESSASGTEPALIIDFIESREFQFFIPEIFLAKNNFSFNEDSYYACEPVAHVAQHLFSKDRPCTLSIYPRFEKLIDKALNLGRKAKMLNHPIHTGIMSYSLFWHAFHLVLLKHSATFFHAGVVANKRQEAIAIAGTGGSGKTSTLFKLLEDEQYNYLSEDFGIVNSAGRVFYNPKALSIYASDMRDRQKILTKHVQNKMPFGKKLKWLILKNLLRRNPLIKVPVRKVVGDRTCKEAKLAKIIFLIRAELKQPRIYDASLDELTGRVLNASLRELKWLTELLRLINANAPTNYKYPTETYVSDQMKMIYERAFRDVDRKVLMIPRKSTPTETVHFLRTEHLI